jgi:hypothetical protein
MCVGSVLWRPMFGPAGRWGKPRHTERPDDPIRTGSDGKFYTSLRGRQARLIEIIDFMSFFSAAQKLL